MTKLYTGANLYAEVAKRDRRIRALERDNRLLREITDPEAAAVLRAIYKSAARLAAKRKERK